MASGRARGRVARRLRLHPRRLPLLFAAPILLAALAAAASEAVPTHERPAAHPAAVPAPQPAPAVARAPTPAVAFARARAHGQPIAIVTQATALRSRPHGRKLAHIARHTEWGSPRVLAATEESHGWLRVIATELPNGRTGWIPASAVRLQSDPWLVRASVSSRTVEVLKSGRVVRRFTVAVGRPSSPTPTGRFAVTDRLIILNRGIGYGCCALALSGHQPHLPQGWGGGDRLAIHSTDSPGTIGAPASSGCLRARDADARWLINHVYLGTIVEIRP